MKRSINRLSITLFFTDIVMIGLGLFVATWLRIFLPFGGVYQLDRAILPTLVYPLAIISWCASLFVAEAYHPQKVLRAIDEFFRILLASILATLILAGALYLTYREVSRFQFVYFYLSTTFLILVYRGLIRVYYRLLGKGRREDSENILILGAGELGLRLAKTILDRSRWGLNLTGFLDDDPEKQGWKPEGLEGTPVLGRINDLQDVIQEKEVDEIYIALPARAYKQMQSVVSKLRSEAVNIKIVPDYFSLALVHARPEVLGGLPVIGLRDPVIEGAPRLVKRVFDLVLSVLILFLIWPFMFIIAIWIRLGSPGPVLFKQKRVGESGKIFTMYKFRTMVSDAEDRQEEVTRYDDDGNIIHKRPDDPRVTKMGRFLRRTSLDEIPQLFNVLKAEMSLVGPRPELPWLVDKYEPWQRKRFAVPQGLTGWWQVNKREEELMHLSTEDDLYYVYNYSLWLDIKILFMTIPALFRGY